MMLFISLIAAALAAELPPTAAALVSAATPAELSAVAAWEPVPTRAGTLRFAGSPPLDADRVDALLAQRLIEGADPLAVQVALIDHLAGAQGYGSLWTALYAEQPALREAILGALGDAEASVSIPLLVAGLSDASVDVRIEAARVSGYHTETALSAPLVAALQDVDTTVRRLAARSVGWRGDVALFDALRPLLSDADADVRRAALRALVKLDEDAAGRLDELAALRQDVDVRIVRIADGLSAE
jgi:HEAT repeat protein